MTIFIVVTLVYIMMKGSNKKKGLYEPKIVKISQEEYRKFHLVRKLTSPALGSHSLLSFNHKKYISKQLPQNSSFKTSRPTNSQIFHYTQKSNNLYIFPLPGQPLSNMIRSRPGQELKNWIAQCGGQQEALIELIKLCIRLHDDLEIDDILIECLRVSNDNIIYTYDSWMKSSQQISQQNYLEIENYFLSKYELVRIKKATQGDQSEDEEKQKMYGDFLFKVGLMILNLGVPEIKIRNYEYCQFSINYSNIYEKLRLFKIKYGKKNLGQLVQNFINYKIQTMEDLWQIIQTKQPIYYGKQKPQCQKKAQNVLNKSMSKSFIERQNNSLHSSLHVVNSLQMQKSKDLSRNKNHLKNRSLNTELLDQSQCLNTKKVKLRKQGDKSIINQSINDISIIHDKNSLKTQSIDLKSLLTDIHQIHPCMQMLDYLGIAQYIPKSNYQERILNVFQGIHIKDTWQHKIYPNGSIYWGELSDGKRHGIGLYLFDSHDFYYGNWNNNCMSGSGTYVFKSGQSYQGQLIKGLKNGFGMFYYKDGRLFEGNWVDNCKMGLGSVKFPSGVKFTGFFHKQPETQGVFTKIVENEIIQCYGILELYNWQTGNFQTEVDHKKIGKLKKCKIDSFSCFVDALGNKYTGECEKEQPNGFGVQQNDKQIFEGEWKDGKQNGSGILHIKNKFTIEGEWKDGLMVEYYED